MARTTSGLRYALVSVEFLVINVHVQGPGDLWYFPPGIPHSLQATNQSVGGAEFMLVCFTPVMNRMCADLRPQDVQ